MRRTLIQGAVLCVMVCGLMSCAQQNQDTTLRTGRELEEQGNYISAMEHYQRMPVLEFREVCLHNLRYLYGDILDAMIAQKENFNSPEVHYALGKAYYEKALAVPPGFEVIEANQGFDLRPYFAEQREKFHTQAQTALESAVQLGPSDEDTLLLQGKIYEDRGEPEKAIPVYQQVVALDKESSEAPSRLGTLLYENGQTEEGLRIAKQATTMDPDNSDAHFNLGVLYAREGNDELAVTEFHKVICQDQKYTEAYYKISQLYLQESNLVDAERVLLLGLKNNPENFRLSLFYRPLRTVLDSKFLSEFQSIYRQVISEYNQTLLIEAIKGLQTAPSSELKLRYLHFILKVLERQRPYTSPCIGEEEHPYFSRQELRIQKKIQEVEEAIKAEEEARLEEEAKLKEEAEEEAKLKEE